MQVRKALSTQRGVTGGFLLGAEFVNTVLDSVKEESIFQNYANTFKMTQPQAVVPRMSITKTVTTGYTAMAGGVVATWGPESFTPPTQAAEFFSVTLNATRSVLEILVAVPDQLLQDSPIADQYLREALSAAIAQQIDSACIWGDGNGKPTGIVGAPGTVNVTRNANGTVSQTDIAEMVGSFLPGCFKRAIWLCSVSALSKIAKISSYEVNKEVFPDGKLCGRIFSRPVFVTENLPSVGQLGDVMLIDPRMYALGTKQLEIEHTNAFGFPNFQSHYRSIWRGDGAPLVNGSATLANGGTAAAFVVLE